MSGGEPGVLAFVPTCRVLKLTRSSVRRRASKSAASADKRAKAADASISEEDGAAGKPRPLPSLTFPARPWAKRRLGFLPEFCRSSYEGFQGDSGQLTKQSDHSGVKEERYSPWASERETAARTDSPTRGDPPDVYSTEQLVPAPASYQPYR